MSRAAGGTGRLPPPRSRTPGPRRLAVALFGGWLAVVAPHAAGGAAEGPRMHTNQEYIEEAMRPPSFDIADRMAVLRLVLSSLPERVKVYPTENYFYFAFDHAGVRYAGNLRLDIDTRDKGVVHFTYFKDFTDWQRDETEHSAALGRDDGVTVKRLGPLLYEVGFEDVTVAFELNDLSGHKPPEGLVRANESYIGPVFDESGVSFFLVFNRDLKIFHYLLDETVPLPDQLFRPEGSERTEVGVRTGFAFHEDRFARRKILVGVNARNTGVNNYLDGPFDQLPDNFIEGDTLLDAILAATPELKGEVDRFGNSPDGKTRYLIAPYMQYEDPGELSLIEDCAAGEELPVYYNCFSFAGPAGED